MSRRGRLQALLLAVVAVVATALATGATGTTVAPSSTAAAQAAEAPVLRLGDTGPAVSTWQRKLNLVSGAGLTVDGTYGAPTEDATAALQAFLGLRADGIVGPNTRAAMDDALAAQRPVTPIASVPPAQGSPDRVEVVGYPSEAGYCFEVRTPAGVSNADCDPIRQRLSLRQVGAGGSDFLVGTAPSAAALVEVRLPGGVQEPELIELRGTGPTPMKAFATTSPVDTVDAVYAYGAGGHELGVVDVEDGEFYVVLERGDRGSAVEQWQGRLNAVVGSDLAVDGIYGRATEEATRALQAFFGITVDGVVGPETRGLMQYLFRLQTGPPPPAPAETALLTDVRVGRHEGFDRVVLEFSNVLPPRDLTFLQPPIREAGSGRVIEVDGEAFLGVRMPRAAAHRDGRPTFGSDRVDAGGLVVVEDVVQAGDFEDVLSWVIGLSRPVPPVVYELGGPARLVLDFPHT